MTPDDAQFGLADDVVSPGAAPYSQDQEATSSLNFSRFLEALQMVRAGDFSVRLPSTEGGMAGRMAETFNDIVAANQRMAQQLEHVGEVVGRGGMTRTRVRFSLSNGCLLYTSPSPRDGLLSRMPSS